MSKETAIQWCDSTVNPVMGCDGCELATRDGKVKKCYALNLTKRYAGKNAGFPADFFKPQLFPGRMLEASKWRELGQDAQATRKPWLAGQPRIIFIGDMGDVLSKDVPIAWLADELGHCATAAGARHRWMLLTKQPARLLALHRAVVKRLGRWPANVWVGTSITRTANIARARALGECGFAHTFLSLEPLYEDIDFEWVIASSGCDWVVVGGESGAAAAPFDTFWIKWLCDEKRDYRFPLFVKQLGRNPYYEASRLLLKDSHGGDWDEWPERLRVREMPARKVWERDHVVLCDEVPAPRQELSGAGSRDAGTTKRGARV